MKRSLYCHGARSALTLLLVVMATSAEAQLWRKFLPSSEAKPETRNVAATADERLADAPRREAVRAVAHWPATTCSPKTMAPG